MATVLYMFITQWYPCRHSIVPVIPADLVEYVHLPSTYIMGIHSSLRNRIDDLVSIDLCQTMCRVICGVGSIPVRLMWPME